MPPRQLGTRIKRARTLRGLTQTELAAKAGITRIYVAKLEAGERAAPSLGVLDRLATVLKVKLADLLR